MDLTSPKTLKELLLKYNTHPSKIMGQNFLADKSTLDKIIKVADLSPEDTVLEIGAGMGTLTEKLAQKAEKVIAIEKDKTMAEILKETLKNYSNVKIINNDVLKISNFKFQISNYKVVANIPYYLTSPLIRKFLESENQPSIMVLMVQKEVAQRICSKPPNMSLLAVSVQFYAEAKMIATVSKKCFWPSPKVDSAIIKITPFKNAVQAIRDPTSNSFVSDIFFKIVKAGFSQPRKQLANNLSKVLKKDKKEINKWLIKNKINPAQRAETLSVQNWINIANYFYSLPIEN